MSTIPEPPILPEIHLSYARRPSRASSRDPVLLRIAPGVQLRPTPGLPVWAQRREVALARCVAAVHCVPSAVALTHEAAALVHGLWLWDGEPDVRVAVPATPGRTVRPLEPIVFHPERLPRESTSGRTCSIRKRRSSLGEREVTVVNGLPVSTLMRTAVDCAFDLPARESICVLDAAMRALCRPDRFRPEAAAARWRRARAELLAAVEAQGPRRGAVRARAVAAIASPYAESPGESALRRFVLALGLPAPALQRPVTPRGRMAEFFVDLAWPDLCLAVEFDGRAKYERNNDLWEEKRRQDLITALGWDFERVTWEDLRDEAALAGRLMTRFPDDVVRSASRVRGLWE